MIEVTADLLARSPTGDVSTRAVCEAAGVGAPVLYRQFGDKEGLLSAVVDRCFEQYLEGRRARQPSGDPVQELCDGWDSQVAFAVTHPSYYRLMHSPTLRRPPTAAAEAYQSVLGTLERCAAAGRLRVPPSAAAQAVTAAGTGVALMLVTRPDTYTDPGLSHRVRDAVHTGILVPARPPGDESGGGGPDGGGDGGGGDDVRARTGAAAARLDALVHRSPPSALTAAETALLREWLARLSDTPS